MLVQFRRLEPRTFNFLVQFRRRPPYFNFFEKFRRFRRRNWSKKLKYGGWHRNWSKKLKYGGLRRNFSNKLKYGGLDTMKVGSLSLDAMKGGRGGSTR